MNKVEKIKAEIERRLRIIEPNLPSREEFDKVADRNPGINSDFNIGEKMGAYTMLKKVEQFIDSFEEPVKRTTADIEAAMQEVEDKSKAFTAAHPNGFDISFGEADSELSNDLEEAARKIATRHSHITGDTYYANDAWFFKKGAQWQKQQDQSTIELAEDHAYLAGQEKIIDMACEFLRSHIDKQLVIYHEHTWRSRDEFIEGFKKAMEE